MNQPLEAVRPTAEPWLRPVMVLAVLAGLFGCLVIYSVTWHTPAATQLVSRQVFGLVLGALALALCAHVPPDTWRRWTPPLAIALLVALYAALALGGGAAGARRGFRFLLAGLDEPLAAVYLRPAELAKPVFVLFLAYLPAALDRENQPAWQDYARYLSLAALWLVPLALAGDGGALLVFALVFALLYWLRGGRLLHLGATALALAPLGWLYILWHPALQMTLTTWLGATPPPDAAAGLPAAAPIALTQGGLWGRSLGQTVWAQSYLPGAHADSLFATLGEGFGFAGGLVVVAGVVAGGLFGLSLARRQQDAFGALVLAGLTALLGGQALLHVSVATGLLPPAAVPLPLLSYGGGSLVATMASLGMMLSFARAGALAPAAGTATTRVPAPVPAR